MQKANKLIEAELLKQTLALSELGYLLLSPSGSILNINDSLLKILNYSKEEVFQLNILAINPMLNLLTWKKYWKDLRPIQKVEEGVFINKNGLIFPVKFSAQLAEYKGEEVCCMLVKYSTEEQHLALLNKVSRQGDLGYWSYDLLTEVLLVSPALLTAMNIQSNKGQFDIQELQALSKKEVSENNYQVLNQHLKRCLEHREQIEEEIHLTFGNKSKHFKLKTSPQLFEDQVVRLYGVFQSSESDRGDFTEDSSIYTPNTKILELVHHTLDHAKDLFFWSWQNGDILYFNSVASQTLGYKPSELSQMNMYDLLKDLDRSEGDKIWDELVAQKYVEFEGTAYRKDGQYFPVSISVTIIKYEGKDCACIVWRDVSNLKKNNKELEEALIEITRLKEEIEDEKKYLQEELNESANFNDIITKSKKYHSVLRQVSQVAPTNATVLIQGETGTGKELLARAIHGFSSRSDKQMVKVNCAALPSNLIESELFGHEKGAFTGAHQRKRGRFELADQTTIFLDEIGELPIDLQPKLLRVLQEGEFERIGGTETIKVDIRVIAATNRDLAKLSTEGKFREDLYYRLHVFPILNIPLRERKEDIEPLVHHFLRKFSTKMGKQLVRINQKDLNLLLQHDFPGNIRELENLIERAVILAPKDTINIKTVLPRNSKLNEDGSFPTFEEIQKKHILEALKQTNWRVTGPNGAARLLGLNDKTLSSKIRKFGLKRKDFQNR